MARRIVWIGNNAISPFEAIALDAAPVSTTVIGTIGGCIEPCDVKDIGISRIYGQVKDVLCFLEDRLPRLAGIRGKKNTTTSVHVLALMSPGRKV